MTIEQVAKEFVEQHKELLAEYDVTAGPIASRYEELANSWLIEKFKLTDIAMPKADFVEMRRDFDELVSRYFANSK